MLTASITPNINPALFTNAAEFFAHGDQLDCIQGGHRYSYDDTPVKLKAAIASHLSADPIAQKALKEWAKHEVIDELKQYTFCRFGGYGLEADIDEYGMVHANEYHNCPARTTCPYVGKICKHLKVTHGTLTKTEPEVLKMVSMPDKLIADTMHVSIETITTHMQNIRRKTGLNNKSWDKGKRFGYGDGESFTIWDSTSGKYVENVPPTDKRVKALKWDKTLTLRFVLLKMTGILGYWSFTTKAKEVTIPSIIKSFDLVKERAGTIVGFPFNLMVEMKKSYSPGEARTYPAVSLIPNFTEESIEAVRAYVESGGALNRITTRMIESGAISEQVKTLEIGEGK